jgi:hypothetical protein
MAVAGRLSRVDRSKLAQAETKLRKINEAHVQAASLSEKELQMMLELPIW